MNGCVTMRRPSILIILLLVAVPGSHALNASSESPLASAAGELADVLGVTIDTDQLDQANIHPAVRSGLAATLGQLTTCAKLTATIPQHTLLESIRHGNEAETPWSQAMRQCGQRVVASLDALSLAVDAAVAIQFDSDPIDLWPVLHYSPGGADDTYFDDYVLLVDEGGNDAYYNNAGGSVLEIIDDRPAIDQLPTDGCHAVIDAAQGQCILAAAALLDRGGHDTYGRREAPTRDAVCTADPIVLRFSIQGSGIAGVGVLVDEGGDDTYTGKTLAQGAGHGGGFGYLRDEAGDDTYLAIRSSQGSSVIGGTGILRDLGGDDTYDYYMPSATDASARPYQHGSGGVLNDQGFCDRVPRYLQGTGAHGGTASFVDEAGDDWYRSSWHGQGGGFHGVGVFQDLAGTDTYEGAPGRADGTVILPGPESTGYFEDR